MGSTVKVQRDTYCQAYTSTQAVGTGTLVQRIKCKKTEKEVHLLYKSYQNK